MTGERLVIKVGTNVLTRPDQNLDYNAIHQIVEQIGTLRRAGHTVLLVSSGAAGAGRGLADFDRERGSVLRRQLMTAVGQPRLMQLYTDFFREFGIVVGQALMTRADLSDRVHYLNVRNVIEGLLRANVVPIVNENDVVASEELTFGDNDYLAAAVASMIGAHRVLLLTTADGFYIGGQPGKGRRTRIVRQAKSITPKMWESCESSLLEGGRGGMLSKLKSVEMATSFGIEAIIASGKEPNVVPRILAGEKLGSRFLPRAKRLKGYRQWLRFGAMAAGRILVDAGAANALRNNKSLLPAGIVRVEGAFAVGDVVEIYDTDRVHLGVGLVNLSSTVMDAILRGEHRPDRPTEAIHKDRLLLTE